MKLNCPWCDQRLKIGYKLAGKQVKCPICRHDFAVPSLPAVSQLHESDEQIETQGKSSL